MQQHYEAIAKVKSIKEIQTKSGKWLYSFGIPITKMAGETQLTEWIQVSILQDERRPDLHNAKQVHFIGQLALKEAYQNYPQGISVFGFYIEPVLSQVYRQRKQKTNRAPQQPQQYQQNQPQHQQPQQQHQQPQTEYPENPPFMQQSEIPM